MTFGRNAPSDGGGFVAIYRDIMEHWLVGFGKPVRAADPARGSYSMGEAFLYLLFKAQYKEGTVNNGGVKMTLQPGQLLGAVSWLANVWNWTPKTVRTFLDNLESDGMLQKISAVNKDGNQKGKQAAILSVCNYEYYQRMHAQQGQAEGQAKGEQGASKGQAKGNIITKETKEQDIKKDLGARGSQRADYWAQAMAVPPAPGEFDPNEGVNRDPSTGSLSLTNGTRARWLEKFGTEDALDLALIQAAAYVQPNAYKPLKIQVEAQLARQVQFLSKRKPTQDHGKTDKLETARRILARFGETVDDADISQ